MRRLEAAGASFGGAGERALAMPEEFRLEQGLRDGAHVDAQEHPIGALRQPMQLARDKFLAGAVLAEDQHVRVGRRRTPHDGHQVAHRPRPADDRAARRGRVGQHAVRLLQAFVLAPARAELNRRRHRCGQLLVLPGLGDEVGRAALHGLDYRVDAAVRRDHDNDELRVDGEDPREPVESLRAARFAGPEIHVQQDGVDVVFREEFRDALRPPARQDFAELPPQQQPAGGEDVLVVIDDQDRAGFRHGGLPGARTGVRNRTRSVRRRTAGGAVARRSARVTCEFSGAYKLGTPLAM